MGREGGVDLATGLTLPERKGISYSQLDHSSSESWKERLGCQKAEAGLYVVHREPPAGHTAPEYKS